MARVQCQRKVQRKQGCEPKSWLWLNNVSFLYREQERIVWHIVLLCMQVSVGVWSIQIYIRYRPHWRHSVNSLTKKKIKSGQQTGRGSFGPSVGTKPLIHFLFVLFSILWIYCILLNYEETALFIAFLERLWRCCAKNQLYKHMGKKAFCLNTWKYNQFSFLKQIPLLEWILWILFSFFFVLGL